MTDDAKIPTAEEFKEALEGDERATKAATDVLVDGVKDALHGVVVVLVANADGIGIASTMCGCHVKEDKPKAELLTTLLTAAVLKLRMSEAHVTHVRVDDQTIPVQKPKGGA